MKYCNLYAVTVPHHISEVTPKSYSFLQLQYTKLYFLINIYVLITHYINLT